MKKPVFIYRCQPDEPVFLLLPGEIIAVQIAVQNVGVFYDLLKRAADFPFSAVIQVLYSLVLTLLKYMFR